MMVADTEEQIDALRAANPNQPIMWERPDKHIDVHRPHGKPKKVFPPRVGVMR
jgi:hypothetical protein